MDTMRRSIPADTPPPVVISSPLQGIRLTYVDIVQDTSNNVSCSLVESVMLVIDFGLQFVIRAAFLQRVIRQSPSRGQRASLS